MPMKLRKKCFNCADCHCEVSEDHSIVHDIVSIGKHVSLFHTGKRDNDVEYLIIAVSQAVDDLIELWALLKSQSITWKDYQALIQNKRLKEARLIIENKEKKNKHQIS